MGAVGGTLRHQGLSRTCWEAALRPGRRTGTARAASCGLTPRISCRGAARLTKVWGLHNAVSAPIQTGGRALPTSCGCEPARRDIAVVPISIPPDIPGDGTDHLFIERHPGRLQGELDL